MAAVCCEKARSTWLSLCCGVVYVCDQPTLTTYATALVVGSSDTLCFVVCVVVCFWVVQEEFSMMSDIG